jgi:hypothetical protein
MYSSTSMHAESLQSNAPNWLTWNSTGSEGLTLWSGLHYAASSWLFRHLKNVVKTLSVSGGIVRAKPGGTLMKLRRMEGSA